MIRPRPQLRRRRSVRGRALPVLAGLLLASGILRIGDANPIATMGDLFDTGRAHAADTPGGDVGELDEVLKALKAREAALDARAEELESRAGVIAEGEAALGAQLAEIEAAETRLREMVKMADKAAEQDLTRLASVYENMKPAEAGPLFEKMPPAFAAGFLSLMRPETSAAILARIPPDAAYAISVVLAGRNANNPPIDDTTGVAQ